MKRILTTIILVMSLAATYAQTPSLGSQTTPQSEVTAIAKTDWLVAYNSVRVDAPINIIFKRVPTVEELRITYDTKGDVDSKFKFDIDRNGTLVITEKSDSKRLTVTDVVLYYHTLNSVKIAHATAEFENEIDAPLFDLVVSGGATVSLALNTLDSAVECTGSSRLTINGSTKYLTMDVSTAKVNCSEMSVVSATIEASHSAEVRVTVSERLEVTTITGARLFYKGQPAILRNHNGVFGGEVVKLD